MKHRKIVSLIVMLAVFGSVAGTCWALASVQQPEDQPTPSQMPRLTIHEQIRDAAIAYIVANHPETAQFTSDLVWTGGKQETGLLGAEKYIYQRGGWNVTISYPVIPNPLYSISAEYAANYPPGQAGIVYRMQWEGTCLNGEVAETSYLMLL